MIAPFTMYELEQGLEEKKLKWKRKEKTTWVRSSCARWETVEHSLTFPATRKAKMFVPRQVAKRV